MGNLSFFDSLQELFAPKDIRFESHPYFSDFYLLTAEKEEEEEVRSLFTPDVLDYLEKHTDYKMEVNEHFILIFQDQRLLNVEEINNLIHFSTELMDMFAKNLKHE